LTLDWRPLAGPHDELLRRLGVKLTSSQAEILKRVKSQASATLEELSEATGMKSNAVRSDLSHLEFQKLLKCKDGHYTVAEHLREII
jgi:DeoR/GlpR family transcriptional regulator of sugar metabolism